MRVSGLATSVERPHSTLRAADNVSLPGDATNGGKDSIIEIVFSRISVELIDTGFRVLVAVGN
jgi:hypothetical protein